MKQPIFEFEVILPKMVPIALEDRHIHFRIYESGIVEAEGTPDVEVGLVINRIHGLMEKPMP